MALSDILDKLTGGVKSAFSALPSISAPSAKTQEFLYALPTLLGAYEQGRGKPIGGVLSTLGALGEGHVQRLQQAGDVTALTNLLSGIDPNQAPQAAQLFGQLKPQLGNMTPEMAEKQLENVQAIEQAETGGKNWTKFWDKDRGQWVVKQPTDFAGGYVPKNLQSPQEHYAEMKAKTAANGADILKRSELSQLKQTYAQSMFHQDFGKLQPDQALKVDRRARDDMAQQAIRTNYAEKANTWAVIGNAPATKMGLVALRPDGSPDLSASYQQFASSGGVRATDLATYASLETGKKLINVIVNGGTTTVRGPDGKPKQVHFRGLANILPPGSDWRTEFAGSEYQDYLKRFYPQDWQALQAATLGISEATTKAILGTARASNLVTQFKESILGTTATRRSVGAVLGQINDAINDREMEIRDKGSAQWGRMAGSAAASMGGAPELIAPEEGTGEPEAPAPTPTPPSGDEGSSDSGEGGW